MQTRTRTNFVFPFTWSSLPIWKRNPWEKATSAANNKRKGRWALLKLSKFHQRRRAILFYELNGRLTLSSRGSRKISERRIHSSLLSSLRETRTRVGGNLNIFFSSLLRWKKLKIQFSSPFFHPFGFKESRFATINWICRNSRLIPSVESGNSSRQESTVWRGRKKLPMSPWKCRKSLNGWFFLKIQMWWFYYVYSPHRSNGFCTGFANLNWFRRCWSRSAKSV